MQAGLVVAPGTHDVQTGGHLELDGRHGGFAYFQASGNQSNPIDDATLTMAGKTLPLPEAWRSSSSWTTQERGKLVLDVQKWADQRVGWFLGGTWWPTFKALPESGSLEPALEAGSLTGAGETGDLPAAYFIP